MKPHDEKLKDELLVKGLLGQEQCDKAVLEVSRSGLSFKECVLKMGLLDEKELALTESEILGIPFLNLDDYLIDDEVLRLVPEKMARGCLVMPVFKVGKSLTIATADPFNLLVLDEVRSAAAGFEVEVVMSTRDILKRVIDQYYGVSSDLLEIAKTFDEEAHTIRYEAGEGAPSLEVMSRVAQGASTAKLVNLILMRAVDEGASDVHIEPERDFVRVRNRVNGVLHESSMLPRNLHAAIVSRIKIMSKLDIAESRKPQDGKIGLKVENRELDIRVSTFPTVYGENVVLRLLEPAKVLLGLSELGFEPALLKEVEKIIHKAYGMILVTGPTGSGKTTSLYAAISTINTPDKNIMTIEDPIEYQIEMVRQTQVNAKAGLTFATGLRNLLRQDPDIIMVGEIRDQETADMAIQAALTGHLVFSTMHTNDAGGAVARLLEMQIEPFLIASALIGVFGQRLVRTICPRCKGSYKVDPEILKQLGLKAAETTFHRGKGCPQCRNTGYDKRIGIFELLLVDDSIRRLILSRASTGEIKAQALKNGMASMRADGIEKAKKGLTTLEEVFKVTVEEE
ncbi:MAG: type II/IV secretion system protein [Candidatus Omnitrophica bacterium]|nr:type II/IV secretion system protein [Candidatus Omnitrophota bacterium]